jgi:iron complex transport system ATP-binding protein
MIIEMQDVSCILDNKYILRNINWTVKPGEHWAVIGLNGSGKTTLLNMINGYIFPSEGEMRILGKRFGSYDWRILRKKIGFISSALQEKFYAGETVEEIILGGLFATIGLYDKTGKSDMKKAVSLLRKLDCGHISGQPYMELSQGEKQKVLIARALISAPRMLVLDEPCAGLDIFSREKLLSSLEKTGKSRDVTLIYVTHHTEEILPLFTHTMLIRKGEIFSANKTHKVLTADNLSSFFNKKVSIQKRKGRTWINVF